MKYTKDDNIFYQNNPAIFVAYLSEKVAVIIVDALPNFEDTTTIGSCMACNVGDSDNKLSCTCEDTEYILELLQENTHPTQIPLIVSVNTIYDKPIVILKHLEEIEGLSKIKVELISKTNEIKFSNREAIGLKNELTKDIELLEQRKQDYSQLEGEMTLKQFCARLGASVALMMFAENDSRSVMGGNESRDFTFKGATYTITINAFWEKGTHFDYFVGNENFSHNESCIEF